MFFLSKLLPTFIYPLGIVSVLALAATMLAVRQPRAARVCSAITLVIIVLSANRWVSFALVRPLEAAYEPGTSIPNADGIVVLGGGAEAAFPPRQNVHVIHGDRLVYAAILYREHKAPFVILSGGTSPWKKGDPPECEAMSAIIGLMGVPPSAILKEGTSANTHDEATAVRRLMDARHIHKILLITSAMHMPRAFRTFKHQGIDAVASPTDFLVSDHDLEASRSAFQEFVLSMLPDAGALVETTEALKEYSGLVYYRARNWL